MPMLNQLRLDHANMARLLHVLQLKHKTLAEGERPDFQLVREVVDYILDYMDGFTVPLERVFGQELMDKAPEAEGLSERLAANYQALRERLMRLSQDLDMVLMDVAIPMDRFADDLSAYLEAHRAYLRDEREELFPLVREHFDDEALQMLAESLPEGAAAKLESLQESYPELYSELCAAPDPMV
ncbi:Hemerythrin-like domain-containing protein [Onishia taeanensis]|jgi:hemerythrin-like domain-containing protein|uniref:Hemerythrin-like domain-containing protein n=2 Tax=Onishia taeanensis TaxID=284577 RepID=A0A1G7SZA8_9GAMM|nr:Hemerythrin-like domain-containing protein [Halomonas taeanensis]